MSKSCNSLKIKSNLVALVVRGLATIKNNFQFIPAFTLAEVLIVLGVIGIVAAMTLPNLITKINDRITINKLRQAQSLFSNALERAQDEYGEISIWETTGDSNKQNDLYFSRITQFLKVVQDCGNGNFVNTSACGRGRTKYKNSNGVITGDPGNGRIGYLPNGIMFAISAVSGENAKWWGAYGYIDVDVNGIEKPNMKGKDFFRFRIHDTTSNWSHSGKPFLYPEGQFFGYTTSQCFVNGDSCTYWALKYNNLDYLYCGDKLSENGPYSCKDAK